MSKNPNKEFSQTTLTLICILCLFFFVSCKKKDTQIPLVYCPELVELAEGGNSEAQYQLGITYYIGDGVWPDNREAVKWYRKAAEQGHAKAQYKLGCAYSIGSGVKQDDKEAVKWFRKAAEQGNDEAQCDLGMAYLHGSGVKEDHAEGYIWLQKAARQGNAGARLILNVDGVPY